ncbi:unnamed protein product [Citrullus colocynthis]|uniref:Uncharacterized protein n=1 Tax=Citrullus colocynthis TaxID=252529 RepID=A0ABP0YMX6_9ROSI
MVARNQEISGGCFFRMCLRFVSYGFNIRGMCLEVVESPMARELDRFCMGCWVIWFDRNLVNMGIPLHHLFLTLDVGEERNKAGCNCDGDGRSGQNSESIGDSLLVVLWELDEEYNPIVATIQGRVDIKWTDLQPKMLNDLISKILTRQVRWKDPLRLIWQLVETPVKEDRSKIEVPSTKIDSFNRLTVVSVEMIEAEEGRDGMVMAIIAQLVKYVQNLVT